MKQTREKKQPSGKYNNNKTNNNTETVKYVQCLTLIIKIVVI